MFAIFLSNKMDPFYAIVTSWPTVIFTVLLLLAIFYWLLAVLGMVDIDILDFDMSGAEVDLNPDGHSISSLDVMSGLMLKLGLNGVPLTIVISLISRFGWFFSFTLVHFLCPIMTSAILRFIAGGIIFLVAAYAAAFVTAWMIKPLRPIFLASNQEVQKNILGQCAVVRTGLVDKTFGEAYIEDGGAGLIVKVRAYRNESFKRGDRVVLLEFSAVDNVYKVIAEADFTA